MRLKKIIFALTAIVGALTATAHETAPKDTAPQYVFYFIGDGMGMGPVMGAQTYLRTVVDGDSTLTMMQFPVAGMCQTWSASSPITDSAAAGTALSTGYKTRNNMLGMAPDTTVVNSMARYLADSGYAVGLVTTVAPDDATPGAFYAHVPSRKETYRIGLDFIESGYSFLAGAGLRGVKDAKGEDTDLLIRFREAGIPIYYGPTGAKDMAPGRAVLLNPQDTHEWNVGYTIDSLENVLTLPLMTEICLERLEAESPERFFMMVEGGNIDHALHANDGGAAIKEILNFDSSLRIAYNFYLKHPGQTLIVVTADHDTGGMALGTEANRKALNLGVYDHQRISKEEFSDYCKSILHSRRVYTWEDMKDFLAERLGLYGPIPVSEVADKRLKRMFEDTFELRNTSDQETLYANFNAFAVEVFKLLNTAAGVGFTTTSHSGNPVPVFAVGVGAERFKGMNNNNAVARTIMQICGIEEKE
ncbi:MAG: alkaline phosphatase [Muribaculaceae bacterium]|nr:alkaline phosphatase [Muribaculaceae bacterium]